MIYAILVWLALTVVGFFFVNKWRPSSDPRLRVIHNIIVELAAIGTLSLIIKVIF